MRKLILIGLLFLSGCASFQEREVVPLTNAQEISMEEFGNNVSQVRTNMTPAKVISIMGQPDLKDKEVDIHIDGQDTIWTYEHPIIGCARFIVIFRDGGVELSSMVVKDIDGVSHYLKNDEFGE